MDDAKYKRELIAQQQRAQARAYLEKNGVGPGKYEASLNDKGEVQALADRKSLIGSSSGDNTLELMRRNKAEALSAQSGEKKTKAAIIEQQTLLREKVVATAAAKAPVSAATDQLPAGWKAVSDPGSGKTYYWNVVTRVTSWTRPVAPPGEITAAASRGTAPAVRGDLPDGWEELVHPATNQVYYKHASGKRSSSKPTESSTSEPVVIQPLIDIKPIDKRKRIDTEAQQKEKQRRLNVDPLDPTNGMGGRWSSGKDISGKMADSTASGPLWQQRPYPAPGQALKSKDKPRLGEEAGPTMPH